MRISNERKHEEQTFAVFYPLGNSLNKDFAIVVPLKAQ